MRFFNQTLKDFKVYKQKDGKFLITAPSYWNGKLMGYTERLFNPITNILENIPKEVKTLLNKIGAKSWGDK